MPLASRLPAGPRQRGQHAAGEGAGGVRAALQIPVTSRGIWIRSDRVSRYLQPERSLSSLFLRDRSWLQLHQKQAFPFHAALLDRIIGAGFGSPDPFRRAPIPGAFRGEDPYRRTCARGAHRSPQDGEPDSIERSVGGAVPRREKIRFGGYCECKRLLTVAAMPEGILGTGGLKPFLFMRAPPPWCGADVELDRVLAAGGAVTLHVGRAGAPEILPGLRTEECFERACRPGGR
jgi:hypothetical protein